MSLRNRVEIPAHLEVCEGDGPAAGLLVARLQLGAVVLQAADVKAVVGGRRRGVHLAGIKRGLFGFVVEQRDAFHGEPPLFRRLVESIGHLDSVRRTQTTLSARTINCCEAKINVRMIFFTKR